MRTCAPAIDVMAANACCESCLEITIIVIINVKTQFDNELNSIANSSIYNLLTSQSSNQTNSHHNIWRRESCRGYPAQLACVCGAGSRANGRTVEPN